MPRLSDASLMLFAQDLTKIALENKIIPNEFNDDVATTPEERAECVSLYYKTLLKTLNPEE